MDKQYNFYLSMILLPLGALVSLRMRDLGVTLAVLGIINYLLYRRESGWVVV